MFWPTDTLHTYSPRRARLINNPLRNLTNLMHIFLLLSLITLILILTRALGQIARDTSVSVGRFPHKNLKPNRIHIPGDSEDDHSGKHKHGDGPPLTKSERREWGRWKARREAERKLTRDAKEAEDMREWLLTRRKPEFEEGLNQEMSKETLQKSAEKCIKNSEEVQALTGKVPSNNQTPIQLPLPLSDPQSPATHTTRITNKLPQALGNHTYHPNGLLQVNPTGSHPIYELINRSEKEWIEKHQRASKTLKEAVDEYKRRYGRLPPTGFDIWWDYVQKHHIPLPDEYDQINQDLAPFWAIDPMDLQAIQNAYESHSDSFTIGKPTWSAPLSVLNFSFNGPKGRMSDHAELVQVVKSLGKGDAGSDAAKSRYLTKSSDFPEAFLQASSQGTRYGQFLDGGFDMFNMLDDIQQYIPPFRAIFSPHDNPSILRDWKVTQQALKAVRDGKTLDIQALENASRDYFSLGWRAACPPTSPARTLPPSPSSWEESTYPIRTLPLPHRSGISETANKTFIHSHNNTMDPCIHPSHLILHGQFISHRNGPVPHRKGGGIIPIFSHSPSNVHSDITVAVGEGSYFSVPAGFADDDDSLWFNTTNAIDDFGMDIDIDSLLNLPDHELEHALDLDTDPRLLWRGSNTGIYHAPNWIWERSQRARLVFWAGGGEGAVARGININSHQGDDHAQADKLEWELGKYLDLKTATAFGAGMGGNIHVLIPPPNHHPSNSSLSASDHMTRQPLGPLIKVKKSHYAPSMLDIAFVAGNSNDGGVGPNNCETVTCEKLREIFEWRKWMELKEASQYRFVMDVDGHAWSARFRKLLVGTSSSSSASSSNTPSNTQHNGSLEKRARQKRWEQHLERRRPNEPSASLVFKATIYKEWWYDRAQPWVHYVPIQIGLEDLWDALAFFRGKMGEDVDDLVAELRRHREEANPANSEKGKELEKRLRDVLERHVLGRKIARRGRKWAERYWRKEDMVAYMFRLFLEYARVMSPNRNEMFFDPDNPEAGFKAPIPPGPRKWDIVNTPESSNDNRQDVGGDIDELDEMIEWADDDLEYDWNEEE